MIDIYDKMTQKIERVLSSWNHFDKHVLALNDFE